MRNYKLSLLIILFITLSIIVKGQDTTQDVQSSSEIRSFDIYLIPIGYLELLALGAQYQLNEKYSIGLKFCGSFISRHGFILPETGAGAGIKLSYYFYKSGYARALKANVINFEVSLLDPGISKAKGRTYHSAEFEITVGHDGIEGKGFGFLWAVGVALSTTTSLHPLYAPAFKIGVHYDF